jgi:hypothetical protein
LLGALQSSGRLSLGILLASLTGALWSGFSFLAVLFLVAVVVLILFVAFRRASQNPVSQALATLVFPVVSSVRNLCARIFSSRKPPGELQALLLTAVLLVGFLIGGRALILLLRAALANLPF